jgi:DNA-binding XRE family transcriptional regulator
MVDANHIRELRLERGMTQSKLANKIETSSQNISHIERGDVDILKMTVGTALKIAQALDCTVEDLI